MFRRLMSAVPSVGLLTFVLGCPPHEEPLEFSEWPPPPIEKLLKQGTEQGLWSADLWNRDLSISGAQLLDEKFPPLAERLAATGEPLAIEIEDASDEALARLAPLRETLRELVVHGGEITETGLAHLSHLEHLESLRLAGLPVADESLGHIGRLRGLRLLDLSKTSVTDAGIERLRVLTALEHLVLYQTALTDACLEHLRALPDFRVLEFTGSEITFPRFREALPDVALG